MGIIIIVIVTSPSTINQIIKLLLWQPVFENNPCIQPVPARQTIRVLPQQEMMDRADHHLAPATSSATASVVTAATATFSFC